MRFLKILAALAAIAAVILWGIHSRYDYETLRLSDTERQSPQARSFGGSFVRLSEGVTHYELAGPNEAPTVVLVHGFSVPYFIWDPTFKALVSGGFRVLRYDLFGRGLSDRPNVHYNAGFYDRQLQELLSALNIHAGVTVVGVSMGGPIAANYAARHPDVAKKVVLFDPAFGKGYRLPWQLRLPVAGEFTMCVKIAPNLAESQRTDFVHPERYSDYFARYLPQMRYKGFRHALLSSDREFLSQDNSAAFEELGRSGKPVLLIWGRADQTVPFAVNEEVRKAIPQAEFHALDDSGHVPFYEHPEIVNPILIEFLQR